MPITELVIEAVLLDRTWLRVRVDGDPALEGLFDAGETFTWQGQVIEIRTGNAGGMRLTINGEDLGVLGERGEVQHWVFQVEGGRVIRVTPTPTPTPAP